MSMLMRYEFRKTMAVKIIILGLTAAAEILFLIGLYGQHNGSLVTGVGLLVALAFGGLMIIGLNSVLTLHRDMNTRQGYMLFMTPNSSYRILGAKVLENGLSLLLTGGFFFALGTVDISLLFKQEHATEEMYNFFYEVLQQFFPTLEINAGTLLALMARLVTGWIATISSAFLADVVSAALLNGKRYNGLLSFLLFLVLSWLTGWVTGQCSRLFHLAVIPDMLLQSGIALVLSGVMYAVTAEIMERRLSV